MSGLSLSGVAVTIETATTAAKKTIRSEHLRTKHLEFLADVSDIFFLFSARGGGRGSLRRREGAEGSVFLLKISGGEGALRAQRLKNSRSPSGIEIFNRD